MPLPDEVVQAGRNRLLPRYVFLTWEESGSVSPSLHRGGGNYSFLDGHVKWLTPETAAENDCQN